MALQNAFLKYGLDKHGRSTPAQGRSPGVLHPPVAPPLEPKGGVPGFGLARVVNRGSTPLSQGEAPGVAPLS